MCLWNQREGDNHCGLESGGIHGVVEYIFQWPVTAVMLQLDRTGHASPQRHSDSGANVVRIAIAFGR